MDRDFSEGRDTLHSVSPIPDKMPDVGLLQERTVMTIYTHLLVVYGVLSGPLSHVIFVLTQ
jgi:hypothetical protein